MARKEYILCDICEKDITDVRFRLSTAEGDACAKHLYEPKNLIKLLDKLDVAEDIDVSRDNKVTCRLDATLKVNQPGHRGMNPPIHERELLELQPDVDREYWLNTQFKIGTYYKNRNAILYVGGDIMPSGMTKYDIWIPNEIMADLAETIVARHKNG